MWQAIIAFITALPELLKLIGYLQRKFGQNYTQEIEKIGEAYVELGKAQTQEERENALKRIGSLWNK